METTAILPLVGVILGFTLNEAAARWRWRREAKWKLDELRIATYAEWAAGVEANLVTYARQEGNQPSGSYDVPKCEKRLLLVERDPEMRERIQSVHDSIPLIGTADYAELEALAHASQDWEWPPFRERMDTLLDAVRQSLAPP